MKTYFTATPFLSFAVICNLTGHKYRTKRKITNYFNEYQCKRCGRQMTDDLNGRLTKLTPELSEINETLRMIFQKKNLQFENS
jgi:transposase-like protein